jgi:hypothetical protein
MKEATDNLDAFYAAWKDFRKRFLVHKEATQQAALDEDIMEQFFDDPAPAPSPVQPPDPMLLPAQRILCLQLSAASP